MRRKHRRGQIRLGARLGHPRRVAQRHAAHDAHIRRRLADGRTDGDAAGIGRAEAYAYADADAYTNADPDPHSDANPHPYAHSDRYADADPHPYAHSLHSLRMSASAAEPLRIYAQSATQGGTVRAAI